MTEPEHMHLFRVANAGRGLEVRVVSGLPESIGGPDFSLWFSPACGATLPHEQMVKQFNFGIHRTEPTCPACLDVLANEAAAHLAQHKTLD